MHNSTDSWRTWLDRHGPALLLYARQFCRSRADAEDAMQEGFVKFWKSRLRAKDETAYLFACVRSAAIDIARSDKRRERHAGAVRASEASLFQSPVERDEQREMIECA